MTKAIKFVALLICVLFTAVSIFGCTPADTESPEPSSDALSDVTSDEKDMPKTLNEFIDHVINNCLPPLSESSEPGTPGDLVPVEYLRRAPQDTVGQKLSLDRSAKTENSRMLYRYTAETKQLVILFYSKAISDDNAVLSENAIMIVMDAVYADMAAFLSDINFVGTVTDVCILDLNEFMHSYDSLSAIIVDESTKAADAASAVCYGNGETVIEYTHEIEQFETTMSRFDIQ